MTKATIFNGDSTDHSSLNSFVANDDRNVASEHEMLETRIKAKLLQASWCNSIPPSECTGEWYYRDGHTGGVKTKSMILDVKGNDQLNTDGMVMIL